MSAIHLTFPIQAALPIRRALFRTPARAVRPVRPKRSLAETVAPVLVLVLLVLAGLIWLAVGGAVMRGTR
jgi:hypothetical protein